jgi:RNA polymerase sigma-70 factor (ECF subfamily)
MGSTFVGRSFVSIAQPYPGLSDAMRDGPEGGLTHIDAVMEHGELANYYLAHSARADMYRRLGRTAEARSSYEKALALTQQEPERQFLQEWIRQLKYRRL